MYHFAQCCECEVDWLRTRLVVVLGSAIRRGSLKPTDLVEDSLVHRLLEQCVNAKCPACNAPSDGRFAEAGTVDFSGKAAAAGGGSKYVCPVASGDTTFSGGGAANGSVSAYSALTAPLLGTIHEHTD